ncbi:MAG: glycosyltransferase family 2 protein [Candidatus Latescibacteria bacterium]|nr:glycosyltransferase family 2 protein [Candidatus Latescibacterota bacterium]
MGDTATLVSVVIPNWNGIRFLERCLEAIYSQTYPHVEVIFVDNGSDDESVPFVKSRFPEIRILGLPRNLGFAPAINRGIADANGAFILTLNNDTEMAAGCVAALVEALSRNTQVGSCAPKIVGFESPQVIVNVGIESPEFKPADRGFGELDSGQYDEPAEIFGVNAGAGLYRKKMLDDVGLFDEDFESYYEDVDLAWRARLAGWGCLYVPQAICRHEFGGTSKARPFYTEYHIFKNIIWVHVKDLPLRYFREKIATLLKQEIVFWLDHIRRWDTKWLRMKAHTYIKLPKMCLKRRRIMRSRRIDDREFEKWYRPGAP